MAKLGVALLRCATVLVFFVVPAAAQEGSASGAAGMEAEYAAVVDDAIETSVIPAYERLEETTAGLLAGAEGYCNAPSAETNRVLAESFAGTIDAWATVDFFRFGPMAREGRYERFAFWPDVHGTGARQLRRFLAEQDESLLAPGALQEQSAAVQGLPALERLLYSGSKALLSTEAPDAYRCALALRIAGNMNRIAIDALAAWRDRWASLMRDPAPDNPVYRTHKEAMTEILKAILTGLEQMRDHRLKPAVGETPEEARAARAPYNRSGQALSYLRASAEALEDFVTASGILSLVPQEEDWIRSSVGFELANLKRALAVGNDLEAAVFDAEMRQKLVYAGIVLTSLRDLFQRRLGPAAGLTQGFNSLDGD